MANNGTRRRRAVRLREDALQTLKQRLIEEWESLQLDGRLTRGTRAGLMQVSVGTAERILRRSGNDRAVLQQAFESVGLEWDDRYCEPMPPVGEGDPDPSADAAQPAEGESEADSGHHLPTDRPTASHHPRRRPIVAWTAVAAVLLCSTLLLWTSSRIASEPLTPGPSPMPGGGATHEAMMAAWTSYHAGAFDEAKALLARAENLASRTNNVHVMAEVIRIRGEVSAAEGDLPSAIEQFKDALKLRSTFRYDQARSSVLEVLGDAERRLGRFVEAEHHLKESFEGLLRLNDARGMAGTARTLGALYYDQGNAAEAQAWYTKSREVMKRDPDPQLLIDLRAKEAMLKCQAGRPQEALEDLNECFNQWQARKHDRWMATTLLQIAQVQYDLGRFEDSGSSARRAMRLFQKVGDRLGTSESETWIKRLPPPPRVATN